MYWLLIHHNGGGGVERFVEARLNESSVQCYRGYKGYELILPTNKKENYKTITSLLSRLKLLRLTHVELHHLWNMPLKEVTQLLSELACPYEVYLHDHYAACPHVFFVKRKAVEYCGMELNQRVCNQCVQDGKVQQMSRMLQIKKPSIEEWRDAFLIIYTGADRLIAPSESTKANYLRYFPELSISVVPHQIDELYPKAKLFARKQQIHIAFIGDLYFHKGEKQIQRFFCLKKERPLALVCYSYGEVPLSLKKEPDLIKRGRYGRASLGKRLYEDEIDFVVVPSICPETFSYTTHEAIKLGYPVLCYRLGAQAEAVRAAHAGWCMDEQTGEDMYGKIAELVAEPEQIWSKKRQMQLYLY